MGALPRPQPAGQGRAFALPSICASLLPSGRNRLDRLLEKFASFSRPAATPFRNCSSKPESHPANFPRRPGVNSLAALLLYPSKIDPIAVRRNSYSSSNSVRARLSKSSPGSVSPLGIVQKPSSFFRKTARLDELIEPPVCRSVFGTLKDQRLFLIAAFSNLTADDGMAQI